MHAAVMIVRDQALLGEVDRERLRLWIHPLHPFPLSLSAPRSLRLLIALPLSSSVHRFADAEAAAILRGLAHRTPQSRTHQHRAAGRAGVWGCGEAPMQERDERRQESTDVGEGGERV